MNKLIITLLFFTAVVTAHAQNNLEVGITAGTGYFNTLTGKNNFNLTNNLSVNGGLYILKPVFNMQFIETGLNYNYRKTAFDESYLQVDMPVNSLELPVSYGLKLKDKYIIKAGVAGTWLLEENIEKENFTVNGQLSVGYDFPWLKLFLTYQQGINKTNFRYKDNMRGLMVNYRHSLIKLEVAVPIVRF